MWVYEVVGKHWVDCKHEEDGVSLPLHEHEKEDAREDVVPELLKGDLVLLYQDAS